MNKFLKQLLSKVEKTAGRKIEAKSDFEFLSLRIFDSTHMTISPTTLKRLWGYFPQESTYTPRTQILNILSVYAGYKSFKEFCETAPLSNKVESDFLTNKYLPTRSLAVGTRIRLLWRPNRSVVIRLKGQDLFCIESSQGSKLSPGDTFLCSGFLWSEPLFLNCLIHEGCAPTNYFCGREGGIEFHILPAENEYAATVPPHPKYNKISQEEA